MTTDGLRNAKLMALMAAASFIFSSAVITGNRQMYWMASLLGVLLVGMYLLVRWLPHEIRLHRQLPSEVREGEPFEVTLAASSTMRFTPFWYRLEDQLAPALAVEEPPVLVLSGSQAALCYRVVASRRGEHTVGPAELIVTDLLGLFEARWDLSTISKVLVLPRPLPLPHRVWEGGGQGRAHQTASIRATTGEGTDWHGTREYAPGDPLRRINWRATARHQSWHVHQYETSHRAPLLAAIELAPRWHREADDFYPEFERAVRHLAWLAMEAPRNGVPVLLMGPEWDGVRIEDASMQRVLQAMRALARIQPDASRSLAEILPNLIGHYGDHHIICLFVPPAERRHYEALIQPYLQQGYLLEVYA